MTNSNPIKYLVILFLSVVLFLFGCEKRSDQVQGERADTTKNPVDTSSNMSSEQKEIIPDLTGNWKGIFDQRSAAMSIIKQNGTKFDATMNINYRQPLHKTINGTFYPDNNTIKMTDLEHSQYEGTYNAELLKGGEQIKGNFTLSKNGKAYSFNFQKQ